MISSRVHWGGAKALLLIVLSSLGGCGMQLAATPAVPIELAGQWRLMTPAREQMLEQVGGQLNAMREKETRRARPRLAGPDEEMNAAPANNWRMREQQQQQRDLLNAVVPPEALTIEQQAARIEFVRQGVPRRRFQAGVGSMLVTGYGEWRVASGWQGNVFVVHSRDAEQRLEVVERYQRVAANRLQVQVRLQLPGVKQALLATYEKQP